MAVKFVFDEGSSPLQKKQELGEDSIQFESEHIWKFQRKEGYIKQIGREELDKLRGVNWNRIKSLYKQAKYWMEALIWRTFE